ncbi:MAG TPA: AAA family ATPase, partial [Mycobacterium sp.]
RRVVVLAPTGKAVDVAVREGAGDAGYTVHTALKELRNGQLRLDPKTVVVVDEAGMVGTQHLRQLLTATTTAGVKTVLVGDAHQLAPVKVRGGMFAQLVEDLPWAQRLSEVWRMRDAEERVASLALRNGGPKPVRRAVDWYRAHDRLHTGDALTMAHDALANYRADIAAGKDALLMTDNWELSDALNKRIHADTVAADAPTVTAARGHHIGEGDTVISRNNDPAVAVYDRADMKKPAGQVRNGHRWRVVAVDADNHRIAARRIGDDALAVFSGDYLREHVTHGYATTIHANQGETAGDNLTAGTAHAVLSDRATRALAYVALTRGRDENHAYLYEKTVGEADHEHSDITEGVHVARRGSDRDAAALLRGILARDQQPRTVMQTAADTDRDQLPHEVAELVAHHQHTRARLRADYRAHDDRRVAAEVLAARTAELQAATELFAAAGGRSFATCYNDPPAEMLAGFDDSTRTSVRAITASFMAVHCLSASDERQRAAVIGAVAWAAHHSGHQVWAVSTSTAGAEVAATRTHSDITAEAAEVITAMRNTTRAQVAGGLVIVEGADQLAVEHLTALTVQASLTNTKLLLVTDPTATAGPSRELTDALADALPWAQHLGPARGNDTLWARAGSWLTAQPPDPATEAAATAGRAGSQLPNWLHNQLAGAAEHRSAATLYSEPPTKVLDGLDQPGRCAVRRIAASAMTSQSLHLGAEVTAEAKAALLNAVTRAATASAATALVIPIGPGTASVAAEAPYRRHLVDPEQALHKLGHGIWKPPAGTLIVLDGADHLDTQTLTWFLRYAQHADTKLLLVTDQTSPGGSRELTDTLAASCPWAAHHLGDPDTHQAATTTVRRLITAHTELADTYREISQPPRYQDHSYSRERSRDQHLSRDDGYDLSL